MKDLAHEQTDKIIESLEKRLNKEYSKAYKDLKKKADDYFAKFQKADKEQLKLLNAGKITQKEYNAWRKGKMLTGQRWADMRDGIAKDLTNVNRIASGMVKNELYGIFSLNANYTSYAIENGLRTNLGFTLYDEKTVENLVKNNPKLLPDTKVDIPKSIRWNKQQITSHITQGVLQGESIDNLSKRLLKTVGNNKTSAVRTARTAMTSAENGGRQLVYNKVSEMGIVLQKEWVATLDGRTRHAHGAADGQRVGLTDSFEVGRDLLEYPADPSGSPANVYNCRCTMITVEPPEIMKGEEPRMTWSEWTKNNFVVGENQDVIENKYGEKINVDEKVSENARKIVLKLSDEYETRLQNVFVGAKNAAGTVDVSGATMRLSSKQSEIPIHEFAHTLASNYADKIGVTNDKEFWKEIKKVQRKYMKDVGDDTKRWISVYEHSSRNVDEFFAEAFTQAKMNEWGMKAVENYGSDLTYSNEVLEIVNRYFRRKK